MVALPPGLQVGPTKPRRANRIIKHQVASGVDNLDLAVHGIADPQVWFPCGAEDQILRPRQRDADRYELKYGIAAVDAGLARLKLGFAQSRSHRRHEAALVLFVD